MRADHLNPGGIVIVNVGHPEGSDALEKVLTATMGEAFPPVLRDPSERREHAARRPRAPAAAAATVGALPRGAAAGRRRDRARLAAGAARRHASTPTTARPSSG